MEFRPDGSVLVQTALSMSRLSQEELCREAAETTRLVRLALGGDSTAFEQIILRYETRVVTMAARLLGTRDDAQDVAQEVFLRAFKYLHRLDLQKPLEPWLIRITVNVCRDVGRRRQRQRNTFVEIEAPETVDQSPDPYAGLARKQERLILQRALDSLPRAGRPYRSSVPRRASLGRLYQRPVAETPTASWARWSGPKSATSATVALSFWPMASSWAVIAFANWPDSA